MIRADFEEYTALQYRYRAVRREPEAFRSGETYRSMQKEYPAPASFHGYGTAAVQNGKSAQVLVPASPSAGAALYTGREKKGHAGIKGTPLENYAGTVVHDHDITFYSYGTGHQECTQHDIRYLTGSIQNEPELTWTAGCLRSSVKCCITGRDITYFCACRSIRKTNFCFCMTGRYLRTIHSVSVWRGYINGNRGRP